MGTGLRIVARTASCSENGVIKKSEVAIESRVRILTNDKGRDIHRFTEAIAVDFAVRRENQGSAFSHSCIDLPLYSSFCPHVLRARQTSRQGKIKFTMIT
jgi:hypothetical protein